MTNTEARKIINNMPNSKPWEVEALAMAIKALEAQPCEDCISREEMLSLQTEYAEEMSATIFWKLRDDIRELPSVTPQRPKGKWIKIQSGDEDFPESIVCSRCKNENSHLDFDEHSEPIGKVFVTSKYCPNCGAKMETE